MKKLKTQTVGKVMKRSVPIVLASALVLGGCGKKDIFEEKGSGTGRLPRGGQHGENCEMCADDHQKYKDAIIEFVNSLVGNQEEQRKLWDAAEDYSGCEVCNYEAAGAGDECERTMLSKKCGYGLAFMERVNRHSAEMDAEHSLDWSSATDVPKYGQHGSVTCHPGEVVGYDMSGPLSSINCRCEKE